MLVMGSALMNFLLVFDHYILQTDIVPPVSYPVLVDRSKRVHEEGNKFV